MHHYSAYPSQNDNVSNRPASTQRVKASCLGWGINFTDSKAAQRHLQNAAGHLSVDDLLSPNMHSSKAAAYLSADLPRELALLDISSSLPKLSTLPGTGSE